MVSSHTFHKQEASNNLMNQ